MILPRHGHVTLIATDFGGGVVRDDPKVNGFIASQTALGRVGIPDDIGGVIAALVSDDNRRINAQRIEASGGMFLWITSTGAPSSRWRPRPRCSRASRSSPRPARTSAQDLRPVKSLRPGRLGPCARRSSLRRGTLQ